MNRRSTQVGGQYDVEPIPFVTVSDFDGEEDMDPGFEGGYNTTHNDNLYQIKNGVIRLLGKVGRAVGETNNSTTQQVGQGDEGASMAPPIQANGSALEYPTQKAASSVNLPHAVWMTFALLLAYSWHSCFFA